MYPQVFVVGLFLQIVFSYSVGNRPGMCPIYRVQTVKHFDQNRFQGEWYVIQRNEDSNLRYSVINYSWNSNGRFFNMLPGQMFEAIGTTDLKELEKDSNNGRYTMSGTMYNIMDTDYDSYAVVWTCRDHGKENTQNVMVIARDRNFNVESINAVLNNVLSGDTFDRSELINV